LISKLLVLLCPLIFTASAQVAVLNPNAPKPGTPAPALAFTHLLQSPAGAKADWASLHGKVVVLEFWATWCAPCIAEIPVLNALAGSLDPAKVQFISVDDEDPAVVEAFLKSKPISGWIGIDTSGKLYERFGVNARPTTMVVDPEGRIVSATIRPEQIKSDQILALADGQEVVLGGDVDPKVQAELNTALARAMSAQTGKASGSANSLFEIRLTPGDPASGGKRPDTHAMLRGPGRMDITNASPADLLSFGSGMPSARIDITGNPPDALYNLHVEAPHADARQLSQAIELAIASGAHVRIEHHTDTKDAYVLTAQPRDAQGHFIPSAYSGGAFYSAKTQTLQCLNATADQVAGALEEALGAPVVNETGLSGKLMFNLKVAPKDPTSSNNALQALGLTLVPAKRPIETVVLSAAPAPAREPAPKDAAAQ
jgi:uncharacterized protein (TIGR03435 family)